MKRIVISLCLLFAVSIGTFAIERVPLNVGIIDESPSYPGGNRSPQDIPALWIEDHLLSFEGNHSEYILNIVSENGIVYSIIVPASTNSIILPSWLTGEFEVQLILENIYFYGFITL